MAIDSVRRPYISHCETTGLELKAQHEAIGDVEGVVVLVVFPVAANIAVQSPAHQDVCTDRDVLRDFIVQRRLDAEAVHRGVVGAAVLMVAEPEFNGAFERQFVADLFQCIFEGGIHIRLDDIVFEVMDKYDSGAEEQIHRRDVDLVFLRVDRVVVQCLARQLIGLVARIIIVDVIEVDLNLADDIEFGSCIGEAGQPVPLFDVASVAAGVRFVIDADAADMEGQIVRDVLSESQAEGVDGIRIADIPFGHVTRTMVEAQFQCRQPAWTCFFRRSFLRKQADTRHQHHNCK